MKKLSLLVSLVMLLCFAFGCANTAAPAESVPEPAAAAPADKPAEAAGEEAPIEISIWLTPQWKGVFDGTEEGATDASFLEYAADRFQKEVMPNVKVNVQVIPAEERPQKLSTAAQTNTLPNMFFDSSFTMLDYAHSGHLAPLDDIISQESLTDIPDAIWENNRVEGQTFFYPFINMPATLSYNADIFRQAGLDAYIGGEHEIVSWTMDEYMEILRTLKEKTDVAPMVLYCVNFAGDAWTQLWLRTFGADFWRDGKNVSNEADCVEAMTWLKSLIDEGLTNRGPESISSNDMLAMVANQTAAIGVTNSVLFGNALTNMKNGDAPEFDMRLANFPGKNGPVSLTYVTSAMVFNSGTQEQIDAAKQFVKFFCEDPELVLASKNGCPVRTSASQALAAEMPYNLAYDENAKYIINFTGGVPGYSQQREYFFPTLQGVFTGELEPQAALDAYAESSNKVIAEAAKTSVLIGN